MTLDKIKFQMSGISIFWVWLSWVVSQGGMHLFQLGFEHETIIPN